ncbi:MAG: fatty acid oxidation complex subunit alpha FadJ [Calditrichaeota bacterium]|nr:MAG: fatty acid oxidation complex subunit alpha FadJ [Calditrichota bacterium]
MAYTRVEKEDGVAVVWLDQPGEKVNKLGPYMLEEFRTLLDDLESHDEVKAVVLISGKPDTFIAGADLDKLLELRHTPGAVEDLSRQGHQLLNRLASSRKPVVAAIHGAALGGGLEVALACHYRIITDSPKTVLGQPEVRLGLLPAGGATQRLPRLVGLQRALDMMLTGKNIYPYPARKMGLADYVIHPYGLLSAAKQAALELAKKPIKRKKRISPAERLLESNPLTRRLVYKKARQMVARQTQGNYPAPFKIIECVEIGLEKGFEAGLDAEARGFEELARTPQAEELIRLFFAVNDKRKHPTPEKARPVQRIGILGAGLMGSGIAQVSVMNGLDVVIKDISHEALAKAEKTIYRELDRRVRRRALRPFERDRIMERLTPVLDYAPFRKVPLVIEAVFEDLAIKHQVLQEVEAATEGKAIFASNTSALPIGDIAARARHPEQVIGMHYFSPVPKMPLLEVIVTPKTADWVTATAVDVGIRQGKTVIVVKDGPGFYTTRILAPMMNEALLLLEEGGEIRHIDQTMKRFGFPVGPITLMDEVGLDVGAHVSDFLGKKFADRGVTPTDVLQKMVEEGYLGRKNGKGFYHYPAGSPKLPVPGSKRKEVNQTVYKFFGGVKRKRLPEEEIQNRLSLVMINEAARCLEEGIIANPTDGDLGAVLGLGFPPFLGGPFRYIDRLGAGAVLSMLEELEQRFGARFTPAQIIREYAAKEKRFYSE